MSGVECSSHPEIFLKPMIDGVFTPGVRTRFVDILVRFDFPVLAGAQSFELALHLVEFLVGAILKIDERVAGGIDAAKDLIELLHGVSA